MNFAKLFLSLLVIVSISYANEDNTTTLDSFEKADNNISLKSHQRDGYMPDIITPDYAKSGIYGGLGLTTSNISADNLGNDVMLDLSVVAGYNINSYLAAESRAMISIAYDNGIDYQNISLFLKPKYEAYDGLNIYSLIGVGKTKAQSFNSDETKLNKTSLQFGLGADYKLPNNFKVFADYTYLGKDSNAKYKNKKPSAIKSGAFTTGITYDF